MWNKLLASIHAVTALVVYFVLDDAQDIQLEFNCGEGGVANAPIKFALVMFSALTSCAHLVYDNVDEERAKSVRFWEYFVTASAMFGIIAVLVRIHSVELLVALCGLMATTMVFGYIETKTNDKSAIVLGFIPYTIAWLIVSARFFANDDVPGFVTAIFVVELVLFSAFGFVGLFWDHDPRIYNALSLVSKQALAWLCVGGLSSIR